MKIIIYAIAKNEAKFARRWMKSMAEADGVYVLDTGSTDGTQLLLRAAGAVVEAAKIMPWRFDTARNESLDRCLAAFPDADILVCTDLDEVFRPGWRAALETIWIEAPQAPTTARYEYVWSFNKDGSDGVKFFQEKVHTPGACRWTYPVHEVLEYGEPKVFVDAQGVRLEHHADPTKSRGDYLRLLELSVQECPDDDRNRHYLGREYMYRGMLDKAVETFEAHLAMPSAVWDAERAASMRYIARCREAQGRADMAELWLLRAAMEAPQYREAWVELGGLMYRLARWRSCVRYLSKALDIKDRALTYITEPAAWGAAPWDMLSIAWRQLGQQKYALNCARKAYELEPDERIAKNIEIIEKEEVETWPGVISKN